MLKDYYSLTKSGLVFGNLITVIAGFFLAEQGLPFNVLLFIATLIGISLVMASGCVFNNYIDRDIDGSMERTKNRVLLKKKISGRSAIIFGTALGILGFLILGFYTNALTVLVAFIGFFFYVVMYSVWAKRRSVYGTFIGAIAGATPPVVGYCAVNNRFDAGAIILFLILVTWQMPHFFAIAIRRKDDYAAAGIPVMPVEQGIKRTKISMAIYIIEFMIAAALITSFGYLGYGYLAIALILGFAWLAVATRGFVISGEAENKKWAKQMFFVSLAVMMILFITITVASIA